MEITEQDDHGLPRASEEIDRDRPSRTKDDGESTSDPI